MQKIKNQGAIVRISQGQKCQGPCIKQGGKSNVPLVREDKNKMLLAITKNVKTPLVSMQKKNKELKDKRRKRKGIHKNRKPNPVGGRH